MEFPDVYKVRRSLWQVAGSWGQVTITETGGTASLPWYRPELNVWKGWDVSIFLYQSYSNMAKSTWSENLKENSQLQWGFRGRPAGSSFEVCCSEGLRWRLSCLRGLFSVPSFPSYPNWRLNRRFATCDLGWGQTNFRLEKAKEVEKAFLPEGSLHRGRETGSRRREITFL